jgi:putative DNA primase/helicase
MIMDISPQALARALGGELSGRSILAPGPGHSQNDRSLSIKIDPAAPNGFLCYSFAGDALRACRNHVRAALGLSAWNGRPPVAPSRIAPDRDSNRRWAFAKQLWHEAGQPFGTLVESYLLSRGIKLTGDIANQVIRFHPTLNLNGVYVGGMLALFRDIHTNEPCGIHRTFLDQAGRKLDRKMLGRAGGAAIKLDADEHVTLGLHLGEGVESALAARLAGFRPVWAVGSVNAVSAFPVVPGIEAITILGEVDDGGANYRAAQACAMRWVDAGREALIVLPRVGGDLNDVWQEATR